MEQKTSETKNISNIGPFYLQHITVLLTGFPVGIMAAYIFNMLQFDFSEKIENAKSLGIISKTILAGHPKSRDVLTYLSILFFPSAFSLGLWVLWSRSPKRTIFGKLFS